MKYCLDANFLMELLTRRDHHQACRTFLEQAAASGAELCISVLSLDIVFYLAESYKLPVGAAHAAVKPFKLLDVLAEDAQWALAAFDGKDLEDALQIAVALRTSCDQFITLDQALAKKYGSLIPIELIR